MLKLESGTPRNCLSTIDKEVTEIFMHPELGIHVRGSFGSGRVGVMVAHGAMALYDQDTADEVDRLCNPNLTLQGPTPVTDEDLERRLARLSGMMVAHYETGPLSVFIPAGGEPGPSEIDGPLVITDVDVDKGVITVESKNEGVKGPDSPLVGPKIRHNPRKKKGGIADL